MGFGAKLNQLIQRRVDPVSVDVLTGYAQWAKNYPPTAHNPLMELEEQAMLSLLSADLTGQICLDLACGSGRYMRHLQARQAKTIFGLDYSPHMLLQATKSQLPITLSKATSKANDQLPTTNNLIRAPFFPLPFATDTFDVIICGMAVGHEQNLTQTLTEAARVLGPGGTLLYSDFHPFGALIGWQRSFIGDNGTHFNLEHYVHLYSDHHRVCQAVGLDIEAVLEPKLGQKAPAGSEHLPVVLAIQTLKR